MIPQILGCKNANLNVLDLFSKKRKKIIIIMDEMDYMNSGDKGGIKELIKYVRAKKTKKQHLEPSTSTPVIFIGTNDNDKKIKELINVCKLIRLNIPTHEQVRNFISLKIPTIENNNVINRFIDYANSNLRKL